MKILRSNTYQHMGLVYNIVFLINKGMKKIYTVHQYTGLDCSVHVGSNRVSPGYRGDAGHRGLNIVVELFSVLRRNKLIEPLHVYMCMGNHKHNKRLLMALTYSVTAWTVLIHSSIQKTIGHVFFFLPQVVPSVPWAPGVPWNPRFHF